MQNLCHNHFLFFFFRGRGIPLLVLSFSIKPCLLFKEAQSCFQKMVQIIMILSIYYRLIFTEMHIEMINQNHKKITFKLVGFYIINPLVSQNGFMYQYLKTYLSCFCFLIKVRCTLWFVHAEFGFSSRSSRSQTFWREIWAHSTRSKILTFCQTLPRLKQL